MDEHALDKLTNICENFGIDYWLDSGTLLGIIRQGKLLDSDDDIDISILSSESDEIKKVIEEYNNTGYNERIKLYDNEIQKVVLKNQDAPNIDISVFQTDENMLWRVTGKHMSGKEVNFVRYGGIKLARNLFSVIHKNKKLIDNSLYRISTGYRLAVQIIPADLIHPIKYKNGYKVPGQYEEYLKYKFGDWRNPDPDWDTWEDEDCIKFWNDGSRINNVTIREKFDIEDEFP